eukprot:345732-Pelagomonas_calceolata.AAC.2
MCVPCLPRHVHLPQHVMRDVSRFRLWAHTLKVETAAWDTWNSLLCDRCSCDEIQDEVHALFKCRDADHQLSVQAASNFLLQCSKKLFYFMSELSNLLLAGLDQPQADQPNILAEGLPV